MAKAPKDNSDWTSLPVLTDIVGDAPAAIPTLTEEAHNKHKQPRDTAQNDDVLELSAEEIAALLAPQLEKMLRESLRVEFELLWQETWMKTRASLPELIHAQLSTQRGDTGLAGSNAPAVDIIPPQSSGAVIKKPAGRTGSAKSSAKTSKNK